MSVTSINTGSVLHRHDQAMSVVGEVNDEDARRALLGYVLLGSPAVEQAFSEVRLTVHHHRSRPARVIALRSAGWTFKRIAEELGYAHESGPYRVYERSLRLGETPETLPLSA